MMGVLRCVVQLFQSLFNFFCTPPRCVFCFLPYLISLFCQFGSSTTGFAIGDQRVGEFSASELCALHSRLCALHSRLRILMRRTQRPRSQKKYCVLRDHHYDKCHARPKDHIPSPRILLGRGHVGVRRYRFCKL